MVEIDERICGPKAFAKFFTGDDFPRRFQKHCEQKKRLFLEPHFVAVFSHLSGAQVHFEIRETHQ
jgi:hypothetical protein